MKLNNAYLKQRGVASLLALLGMLLVAVSLPIATKLVQQSQENRGRATDSNAYSSDYYTDASSCSGAGYYWETQLKICTDLTSTVTNKSIATSIPTNPTCLDDDSKCEGSSRYVCRYNVWELEETCPNGCDGSVCKKTNTICTSFEYTGWSSCASNRIQTRSVISSSPTGCTGGESITSQECEYVSKITPTSTNSTCLDDDSKCEGSSRYVCRYNVWELEETCPNGCDGDSCKKTNVTCTSFEYTDWSSCASNGIQTRTIISSSPTGCIGGIPITSQSCVIECTSYKTSDWSICNDYGFQTRSVIGIPEGCSGGIEKLNTSQSCSLGKVTCESFDFSDWGECSSGGIQTRSILVSYPKGCSGGSPQTAQSCIYIDGININNEDDSLYIRSLFEKYEVDIGDKITLDDVKLLQSVIINLEEIDPLVDTGDFNDRQLLWNYITGSKTGNYDENYVMLELLFVAETYGLPLVSESFEGNIMSIIEETNTEIIRGNDKILDFCEKNGIQMSEEYLLNTAALTSANVPNVIFVTDVVDDNYYFSAVTHELVHLMQFDYYNGLAAENLGFEKMEFEAYTYELLSVDPDSYWGVEWLMLRADNSVKSDYEGAVPEYLQPLLD